MARRAALWAALAAFSAMATAADGDGDKQEICAALQAEIQQILIQAVQQRNQERDSAVRGRHDWSYHQDKLADVERRAREAGCISQRDSGPADDGKRWDGI